MKIVFISNYFNQHQSYISDCLYEITNKNYYFIETEKIPEQRLKLGYKSIERKYLKQFYLPDDTDECRGLIDEADIVIIGSANFKYVKKRVKDKKIVLRYSERFLKNKKCYRGLFLRMIKYLYEGGLYKNVYLLCSSAYAASDYNRLFCYKKRCFRWGYFPKTTKYDDIKQTVTVKKKNSILWVGRFIDWKHPEAAIEIAKRLEKEGYDFKLNMVGTGPIIDDMKKIVEDNNLSQYVNILGSVPFDKVQNYMMTSKVFLATSDANEGWGAVVNEAMGNGCAVVASYLMGSVPFLITNKKNGLIYENGDVEQLYNHVKYLLDNPKNCDSICINAYKQIQNLWNGEIAAERIVELSKILINGKEIQKYKDGPCSYIDN